ncbi:HTH-type transcriptional activator Btr [compost metagenome]
MNDLEGTTVLKIDTQGVAARDRFEFWRAIIPSVDMQPRERSGDDFKAALLSIRDPEEGTLSWTRSDPNRSRFRDNGEEIVLLGSIAGGKSGVRHRGDGAETVIPYNRLYLLDSIRQPDFVVDRFTNVCLSLPRSLVVSILRRDPTDASGMTMLPDTAMGRLLQSHMLSTAREMKALNADEGHAALISARAMAEILLAQMARIPDEALARQDLMLVRAARRCMVSMIGVCDLTADRLARLLGCSRTRLYAAFERQDLSVVEELRLMRLRRARRLLRHTNVSVGEIALVCGYEDPSAFGRAFRKHQGCGPAAYRKSQTLDRHG